MSEIHTPENIKINVLQYLEQKKAEQEASIKAQEELIASSAYQNELKFIQRITSDAIILLHIFLTYSTREGEFSHNSLTIRSTSDLGESIFAASHLVEQGLINPIKRELRYMIENLVKTLYVDQHAKKQKSLMLLTERLTFLEKNVNSSSIDIRKNLQLAALSLDNEKQLVNEINNLYRDCCAYVHVSRKQIDERLSLAERGRSFGFETPEELRKIGRLMFRVYDVVLTLYLHSNLITTGDIFIQILDEQPKWKFHKGKYISLVSKYFDYKFERQNR